MSKLWSIALLSGLAVRAVTAGAGTPPARAAVVAAPAAAQPIRIETRIEEVKTSTADGAAALQLRPAERFSTGDLLIYTLLVRNTGAAPIEHASFTSPIPAHMIYVANSAVGPGAEISYSVDGGRNFAAPEILTVAVANDKRRAAAPADYTTIRWRLRNRLQPGSVARARFLARVK